MIVRTAGGFFDTKGGRCTRVGRDSSGDYRPHPSETHQTSEKQQAGNVWAEENAKAVGNKKD